MFGIDLHQERKSHANSPIHRLIVAEFNVHASRSFLKTRLGDFERCFLVFNCRLDEVDRSLEVTYLIHCLTIVSSSALSLSERCTSMNYRTFIDITEVCTSDSCRYIIAVILFSWFRGAVVERQLTRKTFPFLRSTYSCRVTTHVGKPSARSAN